MSDGPKIFVGSREAAEFHQPVGYEVCISITDPGQPAAKLSPDFRDVLRISFHDVCEKLPAGTLCDDSCPIVYAGPESAGAIVRFAAKHFQADAVVVHCEAGVSRSWSVAEALYDLFAHRAPNRLVYAAMTDAYHDNWSHLHPSWIEYQAPRRIREPARAGSPEAGT
jgi:predicted protein tyrosine phosphatase